MMLIALYISLAIPINIGVLKYLGETRNELLVVMLIPLLLEVVRYVLIKYRARRRGVGVIYNLIAEITKFFLVVAALFVFASPLESENMYISIMFCVNFFVSLFVGIYITSRLL